MNRPATIERSEAPAPHGILNSKGFLRERAIPSLLLAVAAALLVLIASLPLNNTDTFFHLRFGHEFLDGWSLRNPGSVSSFATAHWVPTQWLPEVVMAKTEDWFGLAGVAWLSGVQLMALAATLYLVSRRWASRNLAATLVLVAMSASYLMLSMRPQVISFVLIVVTLGAWLRTREDGRLRWWLVPMTWLWAMCHGMWPVGVGLGVMALVGMALDHDLPRRELLRGGLVPVASALAAALTPVGPELYAQLMRVQGRARFFSEWRRPDPLSASWIILAVLAVVALVLLVRARPFRWLDTLMVAVCLACSVWSWRTVPVAAFLLVVLISLLSRSRRAPDVPVTRPERILVLGSAMACLAILAMCVPFTAKQPAAQLVALDTAADSIPAGTKVVTPWDWGGYIMWRDPELDLLMHGYGDTYTVAQLQQNTDVEEVASSWRSALRATGCTVAILSPRSDLARALLGGHWVVLRQTSEMVELKAPPGWVRQ